MSRTANLLVCLVAASGCTASDDHWLPSTSDGKADAVTVIPGTDIPSQFVDPAKNYVAHRWMDILVEVHAVHGPSLSAAKRANELLEATNKYKFEAADLVALEAPAVFATLSAEEKATLPHLWSLLELPDIEAHVAGMEVAVTDRSVPRVSTIAEVPPPGHHVSEFALGSMKITLATDIELAETRWWRNSFSGPWETQLGVKLERKATFDPGGAGDVVTRRLDISNEETWRPGEIWDYPSGDVVIERFVNGQLAERHHVTTKPFVTLPNRIDMWPMVDYQLQLSDGTKLLRNVLSASTSYGGDAEFRHELAAKPIPASADPIALDKVATPISTLAPGRYVVPIAGRPPCTLDLYATGVVFIDGMRAKHTLYETTKTMFAYDNVARVSWRFMPSTNRLRLELITPEGFYMTGADLTVISAMRTP